ncbi:MAG: hypothetical protein M1821_009840 [Bathelium mastoideum]|nr:MAG: hypothetical protein M1821_009840 [Bathelium mastoideum]
MESETRQQPVLHGREFYKSIGSPKKVLAPMVNQSEFAWRQTVRTYRLDQDPTHHSGNDKCEPFLSYTPMMNAKHFGESGLRGTKYRWSNFQPTHTDHPDSVETTNSLMEIEKEYLDGHRSVDRPLSVQFCANDENALVAAAKYVQPYCDAVDLNLGCPQQIARKGKYGAYLQEDWPCISRMIRKLHDELDVPVTAKIRILGSKERTLEYAQMVLDAGASILTVHARTREQNGHNTGLADWEYVRYLRDHLPSETVIFANGNILEHEDIDRCLKVTGADAVMIAEGCLTDPSIFTGPPPLGQEGREYWRGVDDRRGHRVDAALRRYLDVLWRYVIQKEPPQRSALYIPTDGPSVKSSDRCISAISESLGREGIASRNDPNLRAMKAHFFEILRTFNKVHPHVQSRLHTIKGNDILDFEAVLAMVEVEVSKGLEKYNTLTRNGLWSEASQMAYVPSQSDSLSVRKYVKPWWCCQPYVRPSPQEAREKGATQATKKEATNLLKSMHDQSVIDEREASDGPKPALSTVARVNA